MTDISNNPVKCSASTSRCIVILCLIGLSVLPITSFSAALEVGSKTNRPSEPSLTFMFVHGAFGGAWDYKTVESLIVSKGYNVHRATLTGLGERKHLISKSVNLTTHINDVLNIIEYEGLENIVLVGHSYAGMVITGVVDKQPEKIAHVIYTDAALPVDGESYLDTLTPERRVFFEENIRNDGDGWKLVPWWPINVPDVAHPAATLKERLQLENQSAANKIPSSYILTIEPGKSWDNFLKFAKRAKQRGWNYFELSTGHSPHRSMPEEYVETLLKALGQHNVGDRRVK